MAYGPKAKVQATYEQMYETVVDPIEGDWWLKPKMDRPSAEQYLLTSGGGNGGFIVRETKKNPGCKCDCPNLVSTQICLVARARWRCAACAHPHFGISTEYLAHIVGGWSYYVG
jgi:hypothetical protein